MKKQTLASIGRHFVSSVNKSVFFLCHLTGLIYYTGHIINVFN